MQQYSLMQCGVILFDSRQEFCHWFLSPDNYPTFCLFLQESPSPGIICCIANADLTIFKKSDSKGWVLDSVIGKLL
jgi:hypothetical protein